MICIIGALKEEISGIIRHIAVREKNQIGAATFYKGLNKNKEIIIVRSGVGQFPAQRAASDAVKRFPLQCIISVGFVGGVVSELKISDLILPEKIFYCDNEESLFHFNKVFLSQIVNLCDYGDRIKKILTENGIRFKSGNIVSVNRVADSVKFKEWLGKNYPVIGVEMETASIAKVAAQNGVLFFSLRVVSDEVSHAIIRTDRFLNKKGQINKLVAGYYLLSHPFIIQRLIELKKNSTKAAKTLTEAVLKIINNDEIH